jgi:hypothetical protein
MRPTDYSAVSAPPALAPHNLVASRVPTAAWGFCLLALLGACSPAPPKVVPVGGRITLHGQPLSGATVTFQPASDEDQSSAGATGSVGRTDAAGRYQLQLVEPAVPGAAVGRHVVTITTAAVSPGNDAARPTGERLSPRWRDGSVTFAVPPGGTERADFEVD